MRQLTLSLDVMAALRDAAEGGQPDLAAAAMLAELAGADAVRLGVTEEMRPLGEAEVRAVRQAAALELRMEHDGLAVRHFVEAVADYRRVASAEAAVAAAVSSDLAAFARWQGDTGRAGGAGMLRRSQRKASRARGSATSTDAA